MKFEKKSTTPQEQAQKLLARGLVAEEAILIQRLTSVSYYRLTGYLYPFLQIGEDGQKRYSEGTSFEVIWHRYCFDRRFRVLMLDAVERIEVSVRAKLIHHFCGLHGPFGYLDNHNLPNLKIDEYLEWRTNLVEETRRSKEVFKKHFFDKYGDEHRELPLWMLAELMSMGGTLTLLRGADVPIRRAVAAEYGFPDELFLSWFRSLNAARNICAHHARFWNRELGYSPLLPQPNKFPDWHSDNKVKNTRTGILLMICRYMLGLISPTSQWKRRVEDLFEEYPDIPPEEMGLPNTWKSHPIWVA